MELAYDYEKIGTPLDYWGDKPQDPLKTVESWKMEDWKMAFRNFSGFPENYLFCGMHNIPSGELTFCYGKWPLIVDFPMKNGDFP